MIPKIIHYCWFGGNEFSEKEIKCIDSWKKYCPNYKIKRWDESNFNIHINKYVEQAYSCKKWAFVSDYARFWILYQYGGLYFDNDVELIKPIDDIVAKGPFFGLEKTEFSYAPIALAPGLGIGAEKGNTLIQEILETYDKKAFIKQDGNYDDTTVVTTVTNIFKKYGLKQSNTIQVIKDFYVYPDDYPADGENVCVIGVFDTYEEGDYYYCTLRNAKML